MDNALPLYETTGYTRKDRKRRAHRHSLWLGIIYAEPAWLVVEAL